MIRLTNPFFRPRSDEFANATAPEVLINRDRHENQAGHRLVSVNRICAGNIQKGCNLDAYCIVSNGP